MKHIHILGIGGTFMSALALLARQAGFIVTGSDACCYPPVSDLLIAQDIRWQEGYDDASLALAADCVIIGNCMKRGMPVLEAVLDAHQAYYSGPQWLAQVLLPRYRVLAVAGTHGKTTTTAMLAWIFEYAGLNPSFLIGGIAPNFATSARLTNGKWFIIEADEYDTAFFDKRPKFLHYHPEIAILTNLEFDHADIYQNLADIQQQFGYLLKTMPAKGWVLKPENDSALNEVLQNGVYSQVDEWLCADTQTPNWQAKLCHESGTSFEIFHHNQKKASITWPVIGRFNVENALAAFVASQKAGIAPKIAAQALSEFKPAKRRLEIIYAAHGITIFDDFAHHPTAIAKTIRSLKATKRYQRIIAVIDFASYTMKTGAHAPALKHALEQADMVYFLKPKQFDLEKLSQAWSIKHLIFTSLPEMAQSIAKEVCAQDAVIIMSNKYLAALYEPLKKCISKSYYHRF
ncbi:MAG: UDP-N-acetylmuramate:L-alanyl-gamma-D-glutamyl-meso-diaminopimelate ligase [Legionellaceae bacterium]|nr:UDP-N-acetylmuramate:L-alanyl-gamma-D-glutamyl-meso-diaminopimelate ligase [Legionellaceae bacterium]HCA89732.1 UDP-N-acetylmuramate:L-alanyl-gamma-D-glutamyl-meso-diaminopimelate ligase [Legionellales bacterium]|tara:strand:+ start:962 stop:2341 length:1380 start_codon:yes stop_codon:yes gene_type:complete